MQELKREQTVKTHFIYHSISFFKSRKIIFVFILVIALATGSYFLYDRYFGSMPQSTVFFLNDVMTPKAGQKVLVFSPHPDDETLAAGGYIYNATKSGAIVDVVLVTDGNKHGLRDRRYQEFKKATGVEGVPESNLTFLGYPDGSLQKTNEITLEQVFKTKIDNFRPDIVIFPTEKDEHPDHAYTGKVVDGVLASESNYHPVAYQYLVHHSNFPNPRKYAINDYLLPPQTMVNFDKEWQRFMLTSDVEKQKEEAVSSYQSQLRMPFLRSLMLSLVRKNELFSLGGTK